jgi:hypothetical protein
LATDQYYCVQIHPTRFQIIGNKLSECILERVFIISKLSGVNVISFTVRTFDANLKNKQTKRQIVVHDFESFDLEFFEFQNSNHFCWGHLFYLIKIQMEQKANEDKPLVFQCRKCFHIVGDSTFFVATDEALKIIALSGKNQQFFC